MVRLCSEVASPLEALADAAVTLSSWVRTVLLMLSACSRNPCSRFCTSDSNSSNSSWGWGWGRVSGRDIRTQGAHGASGISEGMAWRQAVLQLQSLAFCPAHTELGGPGRSVKTEDQTRALPGPPLRTALPWVLSGLYKPCSRPPPVSLLLTCWFLTTTNRQLVGQPYPTPPVTPGPSQLRPWLVLKADAVDHDGDNPAPAHPAVHIPRSRHVQHHFSWHLKQPHPTLLCASLSVCPVLSVSLVAPLPRMHPTVRPSSPAVHSCPRPVPAALAAASLGSLLLGRASCPQDAPQCDSWGPPVRSFLQVREPRAQHFGLCPTSFRLTGSRLP